MPDNTKKTDTENPNKLVDLSSLAGLTFGPNWGNQKTQTRTSIKEKEAPRSFHPRSSPGKFEGQQRDRRPSMNRSPTRPANDHFHPIVDVSFYPEDEPFLALAKAIRTSCKTYELFELAHLILEKPERFVAVIAPKRSQNNPAGKLFSCPIDGMPFETEEQAVMYALKNHITKFFDVETIEVEAPKGSFPVINRCGFTGELLGPPNYHRYQELLKEYYTSNLSHIDYDRFLSKIESVKDEEVVKAWIEKMTKSKRYILKNVPEMEEKQIFNTWEEARSFLLSKDKKDLVRESNSIRFHGASFNKMPNGAIRESFELALKSQRDFPLDTANNIRGRLRRMNLAIYKKGSKGVTYVCAVKRKFRQEGIKFADSLQKLVEFIEMHPNCPASKLPELYLEIVLPSAIPSPEIANAEKLEAIPSLTPEQQAQVRKLMLDLRWLVSEGYVTEYGNGTLFAPPSMSPAKAAEEKAKEVLEEPLQEEAPQDEILIKPKAVKKKATKKSVMAEASTLIAE